MTEQEYFQLLERIVKGAEYLANPLIKPVEYQKYLKLYDQLVEKAMNYKESN